MKTLVVGGGGFIGSHLTSTLVSRGDDVTVLDNFSSGSRSNLDGISARIIDGDIRDQATVKRAVAGMDTVFHMAALCSVIRSMKDPIPTHDINATGTLNLLEACRMARVRRFVFSSSSSIYGDSETLPKHEHMIPAPLSPYAVSKLIGEHYCRLYWLNHGLETVALRYFNVFGPRQDPNSEYAAVIPKFVQSVLTGVAPVVYGDGEQTRDFTYVDNVVDANILAAGAAEAPGQAMNVACGDRWSLLELLNCIADQLGEDIMPEFQPARQGEIKDSQASIARAMNVLGFMPKTDFRTGLKKTVDWYTQSIPRSRIADVADVAVAGS